MESNNIEFVNLNLYYEKLRECEQCALFYLECRGPTVIEPFCPKQNGFIPIQGVIEQGF